VYLSADLTYSLWGFEQSSSHYSIEAGFTYKPINTLTLSVNPGFNKSFDELQYIGNESFDGKDRYLFASIDQKVLSASIRINFNLSPDLTLQYWGQPFIASGEFKDYKVIDSPMAANYQDRFNLFTTSQMSALNDGVFDIDENRDGTVDYSIEYPDFNVQEFLSNLVIRWEYSPGSSVYFVWNQTRNASIENGEMHVRDNLDNLFTEKSHNVFLIKFSYRIGL